VRFNDLSEFVERTFRHVAAAKGLDFRLDFAGELPRGLLTDSKRLHQVMKNLLSNAFKFTDRGEVSLSVGVATEGWSPEIESLNRARSVIAFAVRDTGIGIPPSKHQIIFEAFQQADGSTSRRYGGTGLGLAISREIATLLGGDLRVSSRPGTGSTFTLYLPVSHTVQKAPRRAPALPVELPAPMEAVAATDEAPALDRVPDDRDGLQPSDRVLLIVDNDDGFARLLLDSARRDGWRGVVASRGASAVALARDVEPDAITLDIRLPDIEGWRVLRTLKSDPATRHIPVVVISTDDEVERGPARGALAVLAKPISRREEIEATLAMLTAYVERSERRVLWIAPPGSRSAGVPLLASDPDVEIVCAADAAETETALAAGAFDCIVVEPGDALDFEQIVQDLARRARAEERRTPVVCLADEGDDAERRAAWPVAQWVREDEFLDAVTAHLHLRTDRMAPTLHAAAQPDRARQAALAGRTVLIVDDDIRNIFAMTTVLEKHAIEVVAAETGQAAIDLLRSNPAIDLVLMDVMMPGMDGFETMREIRRMPEYRSLPIVAVTAKAMKGDREKTLHAGAWDYLAKPVDVDRMLAVLQAWLQS
jgi:CheY-like chemotaxis protein